jgi:superfamily II DNA/RNA helicase
VAARGLDIPGVKHVVHFELPRSADVRHTHTQRERERDRGKRD